MTGCRPCVSAPDVLQILWVVGGDGSRQLAPGSCFAVPLRANPVDQARCYQRRDTDPDHQSIAMNFQETPQLLGEFAKLVGLQFVTVFAFHDWPPKLSESDCVKSPGCAIAADAFREMITVRIL